jgi:ribosomal protein L11 methyltransferase
MKNSIEEQYVVLKIELAETNPDLISHFFFQNGCTGIEEVGAFCWNVYFPIDFTDEKQEKLKNMLYQYPYEISDDRLTFSRLEPRDWLAEWKLHFKPLKVGKKIWITPPWEKITTSKSETVLIIDPQMAFGTGHHATTQQMVELLECYLKPAVSVLDAGTGSGILAILAAKLGASKVFGFDIEPESIENARHNARLNNVPEIQFEIGDDSVIPSEKYQLILANINRNVLTGMLPTLSEHLTINGHIILSGIIQDDKKVIESCLPPGLNIIRELRIEEWIGLVLKK